jgi:hypothetical protein
MTTAKIRGINGPAKGKIGPCRLGANGGSSTPMPVTFRGGLPIREDDASGSGSCSYSVNSYGILEILLSGQELRPAVEIGSKHTYKRTQLLINAVIGKVEISPKR